jgi:uncharacterized protein (UPF0276 family)
MVVSARSAKYPFLGFGLRLQREYLTTLLEQRPPVDWLEIISDSWINADPAELEQLARIREHYPLAMHGLTLAIGGPAPLDLGYLQRLKILAERVRPAWISDHLCGGARAEGMARYDMQPLPRTEQTLAHLIPRIRQVQETLGRPLLLENIPTLGATGEFGEWEFVAVVAQRSDSGILLDIDNLYFSGISREFDPMECLSGLPLERIGQLHLGTRPDSGEKTGGDTPVWDFYQAAMQRIGPVSTMLEPTNSLPPLDELLIELQAIRELVGQGRLA